MSKWRFKGKPKLTDMEIIELIKEGHYKVDFEEGVVYGKKGTPLKCQMGGRNKNYPKIWIYHGGRLAIVSIAKFVWMAMTKVPVPNDFQVHHRDKDPTHNWWDNLFCLYKMDHDKLHRGITLIEEENETPF